MRPLLDRRVAPRTERRLTRHTAATSLATGAVARFRDKFNARVDEANRAELALNNAARWMALRLNLLSASVSGIAGVAVRVMLDRSYLTDDGDDNGSGGGDDDASKALTTAAAGLVLNYAVELTGQ